MLIDEHKKSLYGDACLQLYLLRKIVCTQFANKLNFAL